MQSQQKKVKWSRGETADALEERTDTGITQVSVSKMENIVADIYGNISRRPALKICNHGARTSPVTQQSASSVKFNPTVAPFTFVFTIDDTKYAIFVVGVNKVQGFLIENNMCVGLVDIIDPITEQPVGIGVGCQYGRNACFAQSNNWGVLSNVVSPYQTGVIRLDQTNGYKFYYEKFVFSAPWYAPNGTQTMQVSSTEITGLNFDSSSIGQYTYTEANGETTVYSWISTGINQSVVSSTWTGPTTTYYVNAYSSSNQSVKEISTTQGSFVLTSFTMTHNQTYSSGQVVASYLIDNPGILPDMPGNVVLNIHSTTSELVATVTGIGGGEEKKLDVTSNLDVPLILQKIYDLFPLGSIVQFPNNGAYMRVEGFDTDGSHLRMYGAFLTPVADDNAHDTIVKVETGYVSLQDYVPKTFTFSQQRLYASGWTYNKNLDYHQLPGYVVGSQVGRFTDFKNDYNMQNEPVVIDINTQYQEKVNYVADYNGVKIFTTASEYAYSQEGGVAKQSTNGSSKNVTPTIFGSTLLYVDKTEKQLRALQYEFQTDVFQSNVLNQMCQEDLIMSPISISTTYDKIHHTGSFIYMVQTPINERYDGSVQVGDVWESKVPVAVCNFVPGNQAEIWARWSVPIMENMTSSDAPVPVNEPTIVNSITVNNKVWFVVLGLGWKRGAVNGLSGYSLAELDYEQTLDFEINAQPTDTKFSANRGDIKTMTSLNAWQLGGAYRTVYTIDGTTPQVGTTVYTYDGTEYGHVTEVGTIGGDTDYIKIDTYAQNSQWLRTSSLDFIVTDITFPNATVSVFDGDEYKWDDTLDQYGNYTKPLTNLTNPRVGFMVNATLESHPIDIQGKTYTEKKRIGKAVAVIRDTDAGAFTVCDKTGYTSNDKKTVNFYGCTGMKDLIRYTIKNIQGAKFTIESLTMIVEYGTLDS